MCIAEFIHVFYCTKIEVVSYISEDMLQNKSIYDVYP